MEDSKIQMVQILLQQSRFDEAHKIAGEMLAENPNNPYLLAMVSEILLGKDDLDGALEMANNAIGISPDLDFLFYNRSRIYIEKEKYDLAESDLKQAIQLNPLDSDYFALLANIKLVRKKFQEAFELSNKALEINAENILALNTRSRAQLKMDDQEGAQKTIEGALREDPHNAYTHANYGMNLLEKGDHKKALEHFKEALKIDPNNDYAQAGMVEALKAKHVVYRWFLKYAFWMGNLTKQYQWAVIIGFYFFFKLVRGMAESNETLRPFLVPVIFLLVLLAFSTWIIAPISNLFLRLNPYGKHLLDEKEIMSANFVGLSALVSLLGIILYFVLGADLWLAVAGFGFTMMIPLSVMFLPQKNKYALLVYTVALFVIGLIALSSTFATGILINGFAAMYLIGLFIFQFAANYFLIEESNV